MATLSYLFNIHDITYLALVNRRYHLYDSPMGRKQVNYEQMPARFPAGTLARIDAALEDDEKRADLIRRSVERELKRRERHGS
jgi:hypothetical protein